MREKMRLSGKQFNQLCNIAEDLQNTGYDYKIDDVMFIVFMRICRDYIDKGKCPVHQGESRKRWLIERLDRFELRYFGKI